MCTAVSCRQGSHLFGRTLDYEHSFGECIVVTPRNFPLGFRHLPTLTQHYAICGMARVQENYPLYFDGFNEKGLAAAGLNFTQSTVYGIPDSSRESLAQFEVLPRLLGSCATVAEAVQLLENCIITAEAFAPDLPAARLHWLLADEQQVVCVEAVEGGIRMYDDPVGVLTNEPPFPVQLQSLAAYQQLSAAEPENRAFPGISLPLCSRGMGAVGLPGDLSSPSRFVRAAFANANSLWGDNIGEPMSQMFHLLDTVSQLRGLCRVAEGQYECTRYAAAMDPGRGIYCYTTCENHRPTAVCLGSCDLNTVALLQFPLRRKPDILWENGRNQECFENSTFC